MLASIGIILVSGSSKSNENSPFPRIISDKNLKKNAVSSSNESIKVSKEDQLSSVSSMADESEPFPITRNEENFKKNAAPTYEKATESMTKKYGLSAMDEVNIEEETDTEEEEEEEEEEDDELRKRIEEFIEKINRGWRDEKLETFS